jgi:hypothetical protein
MGQCTRQVGIATKLMPQRRLVVAGDTLRVLHERDPDQILHLVVCFATGQRSIEVRQQPIKFTGIRVLESQGGGIPGHVSEYTCGRR